MVNLQIACYGIVSAFFAASTISILLRIYSRKYLVKSFGWDDWCMTAILFFNSGQQFILYYFIRHGGGLNIAEVMTTHPEWLPKLITALFVEELYYVLMHWVIKMAFLLFYLRFATKAFRTLVIVTIGLNCVFTVGQWLLYCLQCMPLDAFFHPELHPGVKCIDNKILAFVPAALNIFTDVCIVVLPIQPLWSIQISLRKRLMLLSIISLGGIVVIISILRLTVLLEFQKMADFTYSLGKIIIISCIELEVAILAANAPSLRIFFNKSGDKSHVSGDIKLTNLSGKPASKHKFALTSSSCHVTSKGGNLERLHEREQKSGQSNSSEESLTKHAGEQGITVTRVVGIESHEAKRDFKSSSVMYDRSDMV
ncbi:uncharacterized protein RCO7_02708 [Rhynchosporium graminicola]|uniref:Rhodopsin domain-containing protein n=1 Tax=Rhynchosporium graminicola TaxID=2792576 RepID=A0A1E1KFZ8_9HELO|nr:uncharacterized protein RCO7_02708 [Rhynchosporium commune]